MTVTLDDFLRDPQPGHQLPAQVGPWRLRPYQHEAIEAWKRAACRGVVVAPTGTGKTVIAIAAIRETAGRTLVVVPTERILKTWLAALSKAGLRAGAFYGRVKDPNNITVTIYNSVLLHPELLHHVELVVLDEIHHVGAERFSRILSQIREDQRVLGLTATLLRQDGRDRDITSRLRVVYYLAPSDALQQGYLAPVRVIPIPAPLTQEDRQQYSSIERQIREVRRRLEDAQMLGSEERIRELDRRLKILLNRRRQLLAQIPSKREKVLEIVRRHQDEDRILVFSESIESVESIKGFLRSHGITAETYHSGKAEQDRVGQGIPGAAGGEGPR